MSRFSETLQFYKNVSSLKSRTVQSPRSVAITVKLIYYYYYYYYYYCYYLFVYLFILIIIIIYLLFRAFVIWRKICS